MCEESSEDAKKRDEIRHEREREREGGTEGEREGEVNVCVVSMSDEKQRENKHSQQKSIDFFLCCSC